MSTEGSKWEEKFEKGLAIEGPGRGSAREGLGQRGARERLGPRKGSWAEMGCEAGPEEGGLG